MMPADHGSRVATQLDELRDVGGEIDALAALALESVGRADWSGADPLLVERTAYVLGMIARSAATAASKLDGLRAKVADGAKGSHPQLSLPYTIANCLFRHESSVISRLRRRLAEKFEQPVDHRFFSDRYLPGEDPNAALLRMFKLLQWSVSLTDEQTIESMARRSHR
jgi:hypothetical protein